MKKAISLVLAFSMIFCTFAFSASAAGGKSITLPFVFEKDELGNDVLKYTVAVKCNGDHIPMPEDPDPADGIFPEKPECTEHTTVIFCKHGDKSTDPDIDYTVSYDMSKFGAPDRNGEITAVTDNYFDFDVTMDEKFIQQVTITANGKVITKNEVTGRYVLPMNYSYLLLIPEPDEGYPNFDLRRTKVTFPSTNEMEGYNLYTFNMGDEGSDRPNLYERQNGVYGQDYYVKLLVKDGYRECLQGIKTSVDEFDQNEYPIKVKLSASEVPNSPLPPLDAADKVYHVANIYIGKVNGNTVYRYDFFDRDDDDIAEDSAFTLCGRVYKIDGEVMKSETVEFMVSGIVEDTKNNIFNWFFRIIRMIMNLFQKFAKIGG